MYTTTVALGTRALGFLIFTPFANVYGRRPVYLISVLIGVASAVGAATATPLLENLWSHGHLLGWGLQPGHSRWSLLWPPALHQRGRAMVVIILLSTNVSHLAPIVGKKYLWTLIADLLGTYRSVDILQEIGAGDGVSGPVRWSMELHFWLFCSSCRKQSLTDPTNQHEKSSLTTRKNRRNRRNLDSAGSLPLSTYGFQSIYTSPVVLGS